MEQVLNEAYAETLRMMERNRAALDALIAALTSAPDNTLSGDQVKVVCEFADLLPH